ncbi:hypothetical protein O9A_01214 [Bartonella koehlerae C-29]|uniref:Uncharacterized protein n=1 Tax=Bartonella koehlerae C-29 TaxID=1134510 RepID=A0A067W3Z5_9HYPH|nr:hypothetical protein O9A_01214 [Bartonella koehlerae C-29]
MKYQKYSIVDASSFFAAIENANLDGTGWNVLIKPAL